VIGVLIFVLCFNSFFFLLLHIDLHSLFAGFEGAVFGQALRFTLVQAVLSATMSCFLGLCAAPGYAGLGRFRRAARWIFLFPNMMSPVLAVLCLLLTFEDFPYGMWGVVLGHVFLNCGLCCVWLGERWRELEQNWEPVGATVGASRLYLLRRVILPQLFAHSVLPVLRSR
jgi:ABC-type spermidine/putrescine transport system permease subunit II